MRDALLDFELRHVLAGEGDAALQRQHAHDGVEQRGLAGAVGADDGDDPLPPTSSETARTASTLP